MSIVANNNNVSNGLLEELTFEEAQLLDGLEDPDKPVAIEQALPQFEGEQEWHPFLAGSILKDQEIADQLAADMKVALFNEPYHTAIKTAYKFASANGGLPSKEALLLQLNERWKDHSQRIPWVAQINSLISNHPIGIADRNYIVSRAKKEIAEKKLQKVCLEQFENNRNGKGFSVAEIEKEIEALKASGPKKAKRGFKLSELHLLGSTKWCIKRIIGDGITYLYGDSGTYKSFIALSWAIHVALNLDWFGYKIKKQGAVVYIYSEGTTGIQNRTEGFFRHNKLEKPDNLLILPYTYDLTQEPSQQEIIDAVKAAFPEADIALIVIDTFNQNKVGSENSDETVAAFIKGCRNLKNTLPGQPAVLAIHHCGKDQAKGMRGHSSLKADADGVIEAQRVGDGIVTLELIKSKDDEKIPNIVLEGRKVALENDEDGDSQSTLVFEMVNMPALSSDAEKLLEALVAKFKSNFWTFGKGADEAEANNICKRTKFVKLKDELLLHNKLTHVDKKGFKVPEEVAVQMLIK